MYQFLLNKIKNLMDHVSRYVLFVVFSLVFVVGLFIKAMYSFDDYPYFSSTNLIDILTAAIVIFLFICAFRKRNWLQQHLNYKICCAVFAACAVLYIVLVPLKPFSDMRAVYEGALNFSTFQWDALLQDDYWNVFPGNIKLAVFWGVLMIPFPKTLLVFKLWNAFFVYVIAVLVRKLAQAYDVKYYNLVYLLVLSFSPLFLYINHIYFDIPVIFLLTLALYLYRKTDRIVLVCLVLGLTRYIRQNTTIFLVAIIILYLFEHRKMFAERQWIKIIGKLLLAIAVFFVISKGLSGIVQHTFIEGNFQSYPGWNQIYIGLNEEEFGFMDNDFSYDRSAADVIGRIKEYGPVRMIKIIVKKTFWLWSQGTYQAQRYAFGANALEWSEKFQYETVLTGYFMDDGQIARRLINSFMRAQYYVLFGLMILAFARKKNTERFRLFYYIIMATFLIMLVYELKSRYIMHLLPLMAVMAGDGMESLGSLDRKLKKGKCSKKTRILFRKD